jgi:hypothetical protein
MSNDTPIHLGVGGYLFFFSRYWTGSGGMERLVENAIHPLKGLSIHRLDGKEILHLEEAAKLRGDGPDRLAGVLIELAPAPYRLRLATEHGGSIEQMLIVCAHWQTQVFTLVRDVIPGPAEEYFPDLTTAAILMASSTQGFKAGARDLQLTEIARLGLSGRMNALAPAEQQEILYGKFANPMLGILGAHLVVLGESFQRNQLELIVNNLRNLVGTHPDVEILAASCLNGTAGHVSSFEVPPMLTNSWKLLSSMAVEDDRLIQDGSLTSGVALARWGQGIWLNWILEELPGTVGGLAAQGEVTTQDASETPIRTEALRKRSHRQTRSRLRAPRSRGAAPNQDVGTVREPGSTSERPPRLTTQSESRELRGERGTAEDTLAKVTKQLKDLTNPPEFTGLEHAVVQAVSSAEKGRFDAQYLTPDAELLGEGSLGMDTLARALNVPKVSLTYVLENIKNKLERDTSS